MENRNSQSPYLEKALNAYRTAVKSWGRTTIAAAAILFITGIFAVLPYVGLKKEKEKAEAEIAKMEEQQKANGEIVEKLEDIRKKFKNTQNRIHEYGQKLATELAKNVASMNNVIIAYKEGKTVQVSKEVKPSRIGPRIAQMGQQAPFQRISKDVASQAPPMRTQGNRKNKLPEVEPDTIRVPAAEVLKEKYGFTPNQLETLDLMKKTVNNHRAAREINKVIWNAFTELIENIYEELNDEAEKRFAKLKANVEVDIKKIVKIAEKSGLKMKLPELKYQPYLVQHSGDYSDFETRKEKHRTLKLATQETNLAAEISEEDVKKTRISYEADRDSLDNKIKKLNENSLKAEEAIEKIRENSADMLAFFQNINVFSKPVMAGLFDFLEAYPLLFAAVFFILSMRFSRLIRLRSEMRRKLKSQGVDEEDAELGLCVPDAMLDTTGATTAVLYTIIFAFLVIITGYMMSSPSLASGSFLFLHISTIVLCIAGSFFVLGHRLKNVSRS